jgi:hypothetical protein
MLRPHDCTLGDGFAQTKTHRKRRAKLSTANDSDRQLVDYNYGLWSDDISGDGGHGAQYSALHRHERVLQAVCHRVWR